MTDATRIGSVDLLEDVPTVVTVEGSRYILALDDDGEPILFSAVCPHQGGRVKVADESTFRCPTHRWEFDGSTGECIRRGEGTLPSYELHVKNGELHAVLE